MKRIFIFETLTLLTLTLFLPLVSFCQSFEKGSLEYLLSTDGFKQIRLGVNINKLEQNKLEYLDDIDSLDTDSCYKFCYKDDNILNLGDGLQLNLVGFRTYKNKIVNIYLFFPREDGYAVLENFKANYGKFTTCAGPFMYDWNTNGISLSLRYRPNVTMGVAIFTCNNIEKQLAADDVQRKARQLQGKDLLGAL